MRSLYFDHNAQPISQERWIELSMTGRRHIGHTDLGRLGRVSTVWLGLDHNYTLSGPPVIFETMVFGGPLDYAMERYCTEADARVGHEFMVMRLTSLRDEAKPERRPALIHNGKKPHK